MFNEKRSDLEEQQLHLNVGLQKIQETVDQVRNSLNILFCFISVYAEIQIRVGHSTVVDQNMVMSDDLPAVVR